MGMVSEAKHRFRTAKVLKHLTDPTFANHAGTTLAATAMKIDLSRDVATKASVVDFPCVSKMYVMAADDAKGAPAANNKPIATSLGTE